jgi:hypothetical protein
MAFYFMFLIATSRWGLTIQMKALPRFWHRLAQLRDSPWGGGRVSIPGHLNRNQRQYQLKIHACSSARLILQYALNKNKAGGCHDESLSKSSA